MGSHLLESEGLVVGGRGDGDAPVLPCVLVLGTDLAHHPRGCCRVLPLDDGDGRGEREEFGVVVVDVRDGDVYLSGRTQAVRRLIHCHNLGEGYVYIYSFSRYFRC